MRLLVCGGRDYADRQFVYDVLDAFSLETKVSTLVAGGARGADSLAADWAESRGVSTEIYPAEWDLHGRDAGRIRNHKMLKSGVDAVIFFPGGRGTQHMVNIAKIRGVRVIDATRLQ